MPDVSAIILGASGSVGEALLEEAVRSARFSRIVVISRRATDIAKRSGTAVVERVVPDMWPEQLRAAVVEALEPFDHPVLGFSVLGIGAGTAALSIDEHRAVDVELNAAFAAGLKDSGKVRHLAFMSAIGADPEASTRGSGAAGMPRYARVKGESEQAVIHQGPEVVSIFRPSVIVGSRHTPKALAVSLSLLSPLLPMKLRPIAAADIARAMLAISVSAPGLGTVYTFAEMKAVLPRNGAG
ncbi:NAD(P)H-binding protein [Pseudomarimonas salicorniae]|uniref:NAD(P)H-binding protein n=1 Tax=Pseudomarimonas salicorniae TaxID=2933270 RepID=A0ABT0GLT0_9GAMM|nr:NAD(P)H-binding protein [Lysobacter sp. CAU 1642]MCK7595322.1 NAD(P)H-binding protein [Lysobacter sp. CAU 1642]